MKLFIYQHCPFCVKAAMIFGLKNIAVEKVVLLEDDIATPTQMVGRKVVPILQKADGSFMPESMDIVRYIDQLDGKPHLSSASNPAIAEWLDTVKNLVSALIIPRFTQAPFAEIATESARERYIQRMTNWVGDLDQLLVDTPLYLQQLQPHLAQLATLIQSESAVNGTLSEDDIHLFPTLRSLTIVKDLVLPEKVRAYVEAMAQRSKVELLYAIAI
ncbi:glutaredoxin 2 [Testudinibacter sp. TR-2022]|uniref:glutaredoxin 2 n=1 Tax=Testudinibacter sp. TR-2022 TaxID=2585029 RepID=UPI001117E4DF|nr:glutaredoxin 2 [Testudinibacter sp. TR-2022]TNH03781.1 glutaredoxin 2 [Pasteurellaceae bacterium Phil31]TNH11630.1 glutaredoxin 2 [Testudinibacter sp. TR-2022]TNH11724.1 glutaredoxin 2 [Testudinibacter sp. TR-2022]TNH15681.1 glutaredoxin 2 [Testudinibacter sp. TR-2022]TNH20328.1 glutaredoxin 2 [Testudinibacter sp. TR-2022]